MSLAKGHAGHAAGDEAGVDGHEAGEERAHPRLGRVGRLGVEVLAGPRQDVGEAVLPLVRVLVLERAGLVRGRGGGGSSGSRHVDG